jgi:hypothetical protein
MPAASAVSASSLSAPVTLCTLPSAAAEELPDARRPDMAAARALRATREVGSAPRVRAREHAGAQAAAPRARDGRHPKPDGRAQTVAAVVGEPLSLTFVRYNTAAPPLGRVRHGRR